MKDQTGVILITSILIMLLLGRKVYVVNRGKHQNLLPSGNMKNNRVDVIIIKDTALLEN